MPEEIQESEIPGQRCSETEAASNIAIGQVDTRFCPGADEPETGNYFVATYPPFSSWKKENVQQVHQLLDTPGAPDTDEGLGLYVHIPYCAKRCDYCYYLSYAGRPRDEIDRYLDAVLREIALYGEKRAMAGRLPDFVYFGGGTPSILTVAQIQRFLGGLQAVFPWTNVREASYECAPQTVTEEKMRALRDCGITRVNLGVQQFSDEILEKNGRIHLVRDVVRAYEAIRRVGFDVVNLDLMVGMVAETDDTFRDSLEKIMEMQPESITIYQMEIPPNTPLYQAQQDGTVEGTIDSWDVKRARLATAFARMQEAGYTLRSAYGAVLDPVRHRFSYQDDQYRGADLVSVGAASFSYLRGVHYQNLTSLSSYLESLDQGRLPVERAYALDDEERMVREFVLQLKLGSAPAQYFRDKFGVEIGQYFAEAITQFAKEGWLTVDGAGVTFTPEGLLRADRLLPAFYLPKHRSLRYW